MLDDIYYAQIQASHEYTPRYLFRVYSDQSGGDGMWLNSKYEIRPHGFPPLVGRARAKVEADLQKVPATTLLKSARDHYDGEVPMPRDVSLFSSWTPTMNLVISYASTKVHGRETNVMVAAIDTAKCSNTIASARAWMKTPMSIYDKSWHSSPQNLLNHIEHEYLMYGPVSGDCLRVVMFHALQAANVAHFMPDLTHGKIAFDTFGSTIRAERYGLLGYEQQIEAEMPDNEEIEVAFAAGILYGDSLALPVATALLSLPPRSWRHGLQDSHQFGIQAIFLMARSRGLTLPRDLRSNKATYTDDLGGFDRYPEVAQHVILLRQLYELFSSEHSHPQPRYFPLRIQPGRQAKRSHESVQTVDGNHDEDVRRNGHKR